MTDEQRLIHSVKSGDPIAFQHLVERYKDYVFTLALRILKSREEAEEVSQDVFIKVYRTIKSFKAQSKFTTWLYTITYRASIDQARKKNIAIRSLEDDNSFLQIADQASSNPEEALQKEDLRGHLLNAIQNLPPQDASVITLFYLNEKSVKEIAEITNLSVTNVKTKLHRTREYLRKILSNQLKDEAKDLL